MATTTKIKPISLSSIKRLESIAEVPYQGAIELGDRYLVFNGSDIVSYPAIYKTNNLLEISPYYNMSNQVESIKKFYTSALGSEAIATIQIDSDSLLSSLSLSKTLSSHAKESIPQFRILIDCAGKTTLKHGNESSTLLPSYTVLPVSNGTNKLNEDIELSCCMGAKIKAVREMKGIVTVVVYHNGNMSMSSDNGIVVVFSTISQLSS